MDTTKLGDGTPLPPELTPEHLTVDGHDLYRFTFRRSSPDLSKDFYRLVTFHMAKMNYDHIAIHCPEGYPVWLTKLLRSFQGYGLPVEVTPAPFDPELLSALNAAVGERFDPVKWPSDNAMGDNCLSSSQLSAIEKLRFKYTGGNQLVMAIYISGDRLHVAVIGDPENAAYEWAIVDARAVRAHSDCAYGSPEYALRDGLIEHLGLPT